MPVCSANHVDYIGKCPYCHADLPGIMQPNIWESTHGLRWHRPKHGGDNDLVLEQCWVSMDGQRDWRPVETVFED